MTPQNRNSAGSCGPLCPITNSQDRPVAMRSQEPKAFHKFTAQRVKWPPLDPTEILRSQQEAVFAPASGDDAVDFVFHCPEEDRLDKLYLFYRELAKAGVYADLLYWGSSFHQLINSCGFKGPDAVPAVTTKLGPSINFHISTTGGVRLDGRMEQKEILATMLRRAFLPFDQALLVKGAVGPQVQADNRKLQEWLNQRHGKMMVIDAACIFDGFGIHGVWDRLNVAIGVRGAAILLDQTCLEIITVSERKAAREILDSLCSALVQTCDSIQSAHPHLWDLALLQSAVQDASACLELLSRRDVLASEEHVPAVVAMLDALREVVLVWRKALCASICKKQLQLDHGKRAHFSVSAALSSARLHATHSRTDVGSKVAASLRGFMLNFGLSGGVNPAGSILATQRWWDIAVCLQALHVDWGFAVGCRRPLGTDIGEIIPGFPFAVFGHESVE
eukprot:s1589_g14.t1